MATFDQLSADQRAIIELVLQRGQSYDELSGMLGMSSSRVRELARTALTDLAPATAARVPEDWRGQVADYVLGQQAGPESTATRTHLRRSEAARTWALSLLDSLDDLYADGNRPDIPEPDTGRERSRPARTTRPARERPARERPAGERPVRERAALSPEAAAVVRRRRLIGAAAVAALVLIAVLVWPIGLLNGGDDGDESAQETSTAAAPRVVGSPIVLRPVRGEQGSGGAVVAQQGDERVLVVQAAGLQPSEERPEGQDEGGTAYEVWLYNSREDAQSIGAQVTDAQGNFQGAGPLPADFTKYRFIDISREPLDGNAAHSGDSVLRGRLSDLTQPPPQQQQQQPPPGGAEGGAGTQTTPAP